MTNYDSQAMLELANKLQNGTKRLVMVCTIMGGLIGAAIGAFMYQTAASNAYGHVALWTVLLAIFGFVAGRQRAFSMSVQAQQILCQMRIEENTRPQQAAAAAGR